MGGAYACAKSYWQELHGLQGLISYGRDEEMISLKVMCSGGQCLLVKDWEVGHIYRKKAPYATQCWHITYNQMLILTLFFKGEQYSQLLQKMLKQQPRTYYRAMQELNKNREFIYREIDYLW
jgi:hypothetical protein